MVALQLLGLNVNGCSTHVTAASGAEGLADTDILDHIGIEDVERDILVLRVIRGDGETIEVGAIVPVGEAADEDVLHPLLLGDPGNLLHGSLGIGDPLAIQLHGADRLYRNEGALLLKEEHILRLVIGLCRHHHLLQHFIIGVEGEVERGALPRLDHGIGDPLSLVRDVGDDHGVDSLRDPRDGKLPVHVSVATEGGALKTNRGTHKRLLGSAVCDDAVEYASGGLALGLSKGGDEMVASESGDRSRHSRVAGHDCQEYDTVSLHYCKSISS